MERSIVTQLLAGGQVQLREEDEVEARYNAGKTWFPGRIKRVNDDGTYFVQYDDGDRELRVPAALIRKRGGLKEGDKVEARFRLGTRWFPGRVRRVNTDGTVDVAYDDGDMESGMAPADVRVIGAPSAAKSPKEAIATLQAAFERLDTARRGTVALNEFAPVLQSCGLELSADERRQLTAEYRQGPGRVVYTRLLASLRTAAEKAQEGDAQGAGSSGAPPRPSSGTRSAGTEAAAKRRDAACVRALLHLALPSAAASHANPTRCCRRSDLDTGSAIEDIDSADGDTPHTPTRPRSSTRAGVRGGTASDAGESASRRALPATRAATGEALIVPDAVTLTGGPIVAAADAAALRTALLRGTGSTGRSGQTAAEVFAQIDLVEAGTVEAGELRRALRQLGLTLKPQQVPPRVHCMHCALRCSPRAVSAAASAGGMPGCGRRGSASLPPAPGVGG